MTAGQLYKEGNPTLVDDNRRKRRRRRRFIASALFLVVALSLAWVFESQATTTVVFVRFAEILDSDEQNPGLSPTGQRRAIELARVVGSIDVIAGIDAIFSTQYRSTQETAEPLAEELQIPVQVVDSNNIKGLTQMILNEYKGKIVLVITDADALPLLIREFHGSKRLAPIVEREHDNLYLLSIPWYGKVKTLQLKYGTPYRP
ncbi:MAG: histidine phosphatase family protein [Gammaproteobacteria bacterium]|nr:histidine phosphatase family protein [Gammaproteobacteria bacterium]